MFLRHQMKNKIKMLQNLEISEKLLNFAAESPLGCKILGAVAGTNPPCMINTWGKPPPQGGFI